MANPLAHSWLKPNLHHLPGSSGPINLLTSVRSSQEIPDVITGSLSTNEKEKKLKANMAALQASCMSKSTSNSKVQNSASSGESQQTPRRQVRKVFHREAFNTFL